MAIFRVLRGRSTNENAIPWYRASRTPTINSALLHGYSIPTVNIYLSQFQKHIHSNPFSFCYTTSDFCLNSINAPTLSQYHTWIRQCFITHNKIHNNFQNRNALIWIAIGKRKRWWCWWWWPLWWGCTTISHYHLYNNNNKYST